MTVLTAVSCVTLNSSNFVMIDYIIAYI
jgi:hypothetical protein